ncbi:hypothetical protein [Alloscardovia omnicolens]|uniref:hypothetical protein n=1 Tax=Alloscardovia omnicolens TaxID=419015 RepID=UPI00254FBA89|nr:hypothetical protein [Alloscardovia omnicolens]MDK6644228.1 hypothetical protein [Alloscardovia omnicolens]
MVDYKDMRPTSQETKDIGLFIRDRFRQQGLTNARIAPLLSRQDSYVDLRVAGRRPFTIDDLEVIREKLGYTSLEDFFTTYFKYQALHKTVDSNNPPQDSVQSSSEPVDRVIGLFIKAEMKRRKIPIKTISKWIRRKEGYVEMCINGKTSSFTLRYVETIAHNLGYKDLFDFLAAANQYKQTLGI